MLKNICVFNEQGEIQFFIDRKDGKCFRDYSPGPRHGVVDPIKLRDEYGDNLIDFVSQNKGINGELLEYFRVGWPSGDVIRRVSLHAGHPLAGSMRSWWEVVSSRFTVDGEEFLPAKQYRGTGSDLTPEQIQQMAGAKAAIENIYSQWGGGA